MMNLLKVASDFIEFNFNDQVYLEGLTIPLMLFKIEYFFLLPGNIPSFPNKAFSKHLKKKRLVKLRIQNLKITVTQYIFHTVYLRHVKNKIRKSRQCPAPNMD